MTENNNNRYTLVGSPRSRAFRVIWTLEELGLPYEIVDVGPHDESIKTLNPSGKIPALIDHSADSAAIIDSVAIVQYLADRHGQLTSPAGTIERAQQDSFTQFACDDMDGIIWTVAKHTFVMPEELRATESVMKAAEWDFNRAMNALAERIGDHTFVMGEQFTVPDIILGHCAGWAGRAGLEISQPALQSYFERLFAREAFQKAFALRGDS